MVGYKIAIQGCSVSGDQSFPWTVPKGISGRLQFGCYRFALCHGGVQGFRVREGVSSGLGHGVEASHITTAFLLVSR